MSRTKRVLPAALLVVSGLIACASPTSPSIAACQSDDVCPAGARCTASACVANSPPVARFTLSGDPEANVQITLDASSSSDPDEGDSIQSYAWSVAKTNAACEAPTISDRTQTVSVRFPCAGEFEISLVVIDEMHAESTPRKKSVAVTARTGSVLVEAGPDQTLDHTCDGEPLVCRPATEGGNAGPIQLSATLKSPSFQNVRWTVVPPTGRAIGPGTGRTVTFAPSNTALNPTVELVTDGAAISGDWDFRVEVLDGVGVLDAAVTRVSIRNQAPTIVVGSTGAFEHSFDPGSQSYFVRSSFPVQIDDPDGDPVTPRVTYQHTGDGDATFSARWIPADDAGTLPSRVGIDVVANTSAELIAPGIARSIVIEATDVNGASVGGAPFHVAIGNRPPVRTGLGDADAPHAFDSPSYRYFSTPRVGEWADPDGDPLSYEVMADEDCPEYTETSGTLRLACAAGAPLSAFLRQRTAIVTVSDPWTALEPSTVPFRIGNRKPIVAPPVYRPGVTCAAHAGTGQPSCDTSSYVPPNAFSAINGLAPNAASDPDGDPLELHPSSNAILTSCEPNTSCSLRLAIPVRYSCSLSPPTSTVPYFATDGVDSTPGALTVEPHCR